MIRYRKYYLVTGLIMIAVAGLLSLENCTQPKKPAEGGTSDSAPASAGARPGLGAEIAGTGATPRFAGSTPQFAGSQACARCHPAIYQEHLTSFHHLTTVPADRHTLMGDFDGANRYTINDHLYLAAERRNDSFYQTAYLRGVPKLTRSFDIVVGSGKRGQTSIYWYHNYLFELPLTWFTETNEWTISPGYERKADFNRSITARCLECHSTYFEQTTNKDSKADEFSKTNIILGVECERCHGSGTAHIAFHEKHPEDKTGYAIFNPGKATRQQSLDLCRLCHNGGLTPSRPSFTFQAGDSLFRFFEKAAVKPVAGLDVHGNQYAMLAASKCFLNSQMTCLTCHDAHKNESKLATSFYVKCETCHKSESHQTCPLASRVSRSWLTANCVNCHMPEQASKAIMVIRQNESIPTSAHMRSHYIAIYKDISDKILSARKQKG